MVSTMTLPGEVADVSIQGELMPAQQLKLSPGFQCRVE